MVDTGVDWLEEGSARVSEVYRSYVDTVSRSHGRASLFLTILALACFLPGFFSLPPIDRDEVRFAQATRQMVHSGDWVDIRLQEKPRYKQPIGIYWLQALAVMALGDRGVAPIWVHRLPSLFGAVAAVLLTYWVALAMMGPYAALLSGAILALSLILGIESRLAKTDAILLCTILLAQGVLARAYLGIALKKQAFFDGTRRWLLPFIFWTAMGLGTLVKGPIILLVVGLTAISLALTEQSANFFRQIFPLPGLVWFLILVLPWYVLIGIRSEGEFYQTAIGFSVLGKVYQGHEGHGAPPLTHLAAFWATFWPGSLLVGLSLPLIWQQRRMPWMRFLLCWVVPTWIVFEVIVTKLPHYVLPTFPALAIAAAGCLLTKHRLVGSKFSQRSVQTLLVFAGLTGCISIVVAAWFAYGQKFSWQIPVLACMAVVLIGLAVSQAIRSLDRSDLTGLVVSMGVSLIAFYWLFYPLVSRIEILWPAPRLAAIIASYGVCERPFLVSAGYGEPSLVFLTRTDIVLSLGKETSRLLAGQDCAIAIVEGRQRGAFDAGAQANGLNLRLIGEVFGFNLGGGHMLDIAVFANEKTPRH